KDCHGRPANKKVDRFLRIARNSAASDSPSETEFHAELDLPGAGGEIRLPHFRRGLPECPRIRREISRLRELDTIEQVVTFTSKLQVGTLGKVHGLLQSQVPVVHACAVKVISSEVARTAEGSVREKSQVRASLCARTDNRCECAHGIVVRTLR